MSLADHLRGAKTIMRPAEDERFASGWLHRRVRRHGDGTQRLLQFTVIAIFMSTWAAAVGWSAEEPYLFDLLRKPPYRTAWVAMLRHERHLQPWLAGVAASNGACVGSPSRWVTEGARKFRYATVCRAHACRADFVWVVFDVGGKHAWALHNLPGVDGEQVRWYGKPDVAMRSLLQRLAQE